MSEPRVRLGHPALAVRNPDRLESFYRDVIGLQLVRRHVNEHTGDAVLFSGSPDEEDHELVLLGNPQATHVAFRVPTLAALAGFYRRAAASGGDDAAVPAELRPCATKVSHLASGTMTVSRYAGEMAIVRLRFGR